MKRVALVCLAALCGALLALPAEASNCHAVVVPVVQKVAVVTPVVPVVAVPVVVPLYSAAYAPPSASAEEVRELRERLKALEQRGATRPMPPADPFNPEPVRADRLSTLLSQSCLSCHGSSVAKAKGGGTVLDGTLTPETLGAVIEQVSTGAMPRGVRMEPAQRLELIAALVGKK